MVEIVKNKALLENISFSDGAVALENDYIITFYKECFTTGGFDTEIITTGNPHYLKVWLNRTDPDFYICIKPSIISESNFYLGMTMEIYKDNECVDTTEFRSTSMIGASNYFIMGAFITDYGISFNIGLNSAGSGPAGRILTENKALANANFFPIILVYDEVPTLIYNIINNNPSTNSGSSNTYKVFSLNHVSYEEIIEEAHYIGFDYGDQKMLLTQAYSFEHPINTPHLFRVIGKSSNVSLGRIMVNNKKLYWVGRFALEFNE